MVSSLSGAPAQPKLGHPGLEQVLERPVQAVSRREFSFFLRCFFVFTNTPQEIRQDCFWTHLKPVAASARGPDGLANADAVEWTVCEGRGLLITTEAMDFWLRTDRRSATHAVYWPAAVLLIIIGPHISNGAQLRARLAQV
jgi:hypothetical protein